jgi:hypothetical protein
MFGVRRLDPTERHQGMVAALVAECVVKLSAFLIIGVYVTWFLFSGPADILAKIDAQQLDQLVSLRSGEHPGLNWLTLIVLGFAGIYCLPRQFHVAVVENSNARHLRMLPWTFPLYTLLISLFVIPVAAAGLLLGLAPEHGDRFMLLVPQAANNQWLTLLGFLGGFAAATGMVIITTMSLATMASNHLLLPVCEKIPPLKGLRSWMLQMRWLLVALILTADLFACMRGDPLLRQARPTGLDAYIDFARKQAEARRILTRYLPPGKVDSALAQITDDLQASAKTSITIIELMEFHRLLEQLLAGSIGAAAAHGAVADGIRYTEREAADLKALYSRLAHEISPQLASEQSGGEKSTYGALVELQQKLDQAETTQQAQAQRIAQLEARLEKQYEQNFKLRLSEQRLRRENEQLKSRFLTTDEGRATGKEEGA